MYGNLSRAMLTVQYRYRDVSYSVPHPSGDGDLTLLTDISGFCKPGEVRAFCEGLASLWVSEMSNNRKMGGHARLIGH